MDQVFQALASKTRRQILDLVKDQPGCLVIDICQHFEMSRIAVMKHLKILEQANLLVTEKIGKSRHHYFNVVPIQQIYERWTDEYSRFMASRLTGFKQHLENGVTDIEKGEEDDKQHQKKYP